MGRRIFLALLVGAALSCAAAAPAQEGAPKQTPPDRVTVAETKALLADKKPALALDVRHGIETRIKGAKHIQLDQLESRLSELPRDREIITYCS